MRSRFVALALIYALLLTGLLPTSAFARMSGKGGGASVEVKMHFTGEGKARRRYLLEELPAPPQLAPKPVLPTFETKLELSDGKSSPVITMFPKETTTPKQPPLTKQTLEPKQTGSIGQIMPNQKNYIQSRPGHAPLVWGPVLRKETEFKGPHTASDPVYAEYKYVNLQDARKYCASLPSVNGEQPRLPSRTEFGSLVKSLRFPVGHESYGRYNSTAVPDLSEAVYSWTSTPALAPNPINPETGAPIHYGNYYRFDAARGISGPADPDVPASPVRCVTGPQIEPDEYL